MCIRDRPVCVSHVVLGAQPRLWGGASDRVAVDHAGDLVLHVPVAAEAGVTLMSCGCSSGEGARGLADSAPTAAVGPAGRLPCGARSQGLRHNSLRSLRSLRSDRCRKSEVEARCARWPRALCSSAPQSRCAGQPARAFAATLVVSSSKGANMCSRQAVPGGGEFAATRSAGLRSARAQRAHPHLTCGSCLSAVNGVNAASSAARPQTEHRSAVGAQRRPPQPELPPGTACRDARCVEPTAMAS